MPQAEAMEKAKRTKTPEPIVVLRRRYGLDGVPQGVPQEWDEGEEYPVGTRIDEVERTILASPGDFEYMIVRRVRRFKTRRVERSEVVD